MTVLVFMRNNLYCGSSWGEKWLLNGYRGNSICCVHVGKCSLYMKNLTHSSFSCMIISILYMFRAVTWPSSGELNVSIRHLVYVTLKTIIWYMSLLNKYLVCHSENKYLVYVTLKTNTCYVTLKTSTWYKSLWKQVSGLCHSENKYLVYVILKTST